MSDLYRVRHCFGCLKFEQNSVDNYFVVRIRQNMDSKLLLHSIPLPSFSFWLMHVVSKRRIRRLISHVQMDVTSLLISASSIPSRHLSVSRRSRQGTCSFDALQIIFLQICAERTVFLCLLTGLHSQPTLCNTCSSCVRVCGTSVDLLVCGLGHHTDNSLLNQVLDCGTSQASVDLHAAMRNSITVESSNVP